MPTLDQLFINMESELEHFGGFDKPALEKPDTLSAKKFTGKKIGTIHIDHVTKEIKIVPFESNEL